MRIVEREGTGIGPVIKGVIKPTVLMVSLTLLGATQAQAQVNVALDSCGAVSVATAQDGQLYVGKGAFEASNYALIKLRTVGANVVYAAGEGTGINSAGEGTGAPGEDGSGNPGTNSAGEGTGDSTDPGPGTNAAGEGTGNPQDSGPSNYWGWAEILMTDEQLADVIIYSQATGYMTEQQVYPNVAVSGPASGNGCDRE